MENSIITLLAVTAALLLGVPLSLWALAYVTNRAIIMSRQRTRQREVPARSDDPPAA